MALLRLKPCNGLQFDLEVLGYVLSTDWASPWELTLETSETHPEIEEGWYLCLGKLGLFSRNYSVRHGN